MVRVDFFPHYLETGFIFFLIDDVLCLLAVVLKWGELFGFFSLRIAFSY